MNLILHIKICEGSFNFSAPVKIKGAQYIDIDNFSDAAMVDTVNKAVELSDKLMVFVQIDGGYDIGQLMKVFQKLMKYHGSSRVLYSENHEKLDKLLVLLKGEIIKADSFLLKCNEYFN